MWGEDRADDGVADDGEEHGDDTSAGVASWLAAVWRWFWLRGSKSAMYNVVRPRDQRGAILSGFRGKIVLLGDTLGLSMWQYYYVAWK